MINLYSVFLSSLGPLLGVCAGRIGQVNANFSIQSATSGLGKFQSATDPLKSKFGRLVTNFGSLNSKG